MWRHTWVLKGPDLNKMLKPARLESLGVFKHAGQIIYENVKRETDLR